MAAEGGAEVIVTDKADHAGGFWMASGGGCTMGGGNIVQQRAGVEDDVDTWFEDEMYSNDYRGDATIMRVLCERGAETVAWMEELGMPWSDLQKGMLRGETMRGLWPAPNPDLYVGGWGSTTGPHAGICWTQTWENKLDELGVPILLEHKMTKLYRDGDDPVVGAEGTINIKARKALVVATGSWTDNDHMVQMYDPRAAGENCYGDGGCPRANVVFNEATGDGHIAINEIGGILTDMSFPCYLWIWWGLKSFWSWGKPPYDWTDNSSWSRGKTLGSDAFFGTGIVVRENGKRYFHETLGKSTSLFGDGESNEAFGSSAEAQLAQLTASAGKGEHCENPEVSKYTQAYLSLPQPRNVWAICDVTIAEAIQWPIDEIMDPTPLTGSLLDPKCVAYADTLKELAEKCDLPADELKATVERYNSFVENGADEDFGCTELPLKIENPPFYAERASLVRHTARNGIRVNSKSQVIDSGTMRETACMTCDEEPAIPHLYACSEVGNAQGYRRPHNSLGHYCTAARIAGENAAAEEPLA